MSDEAVPSWKILRALLVYTASRSSWQKSEQKYLSRVTRNAGSDFCLGIPCTTTCWRLGKYRKEASLRVYPITHAPHASTVSPYYILGLLGIWSHPVQPSPRSYCFIHLNPHLRRTIPVTQVINWWAQSIRQPPSLWCANAIPVITNSNPQTLFQWRLRAETRWTSL